MTKQRPTTLLDDILNAVDFALRKFKPEGHRKDKIEEWLIRCLEFGMTGSIVTKEGSKPINLWHNLRKEMQLDLVTLHAGAPLRPIEEVRDLEAKNEEQDRIEADAELLQDHAVDDQDSSIQRLLTMLGDDKKLITRVSQHSDTHQVHVTDIGLMKSSIRASAQL